MTVKILMNPHPGFVDILALERLLDARHLVNGDYEILFLDLDAHPGEDVIDIGVRSPPEGEQDRYAALCKQLGAAPVQAISRMLVLDGKMNGAAHREDLTWLVKRGWWTLFPQGATGLVNGDAVRPVRQRFLAEAMGAAATFTRFYEDPAVADAFGQIQMEDLDSTNRVWRERIRTLPKMPEFNKAFGGLLHQPARPFSVRVLAFAHWMPGDDETSVRSALAAWQAKVTQVKATETAAKDQVGEGMRFREVRWRDRPYVVAFLGTASPFDPGAAFATMRGLDLLVAREGASGRTAFMAKRGSGLGPLLMDVRDLLNRDDKDRGLWELVEPREEGQEPMLIPRRDGTRASTVTDDADKVFAVIEGCAATR
ncbi:hypothetical protein A2856_01605 [Candidatus Uhrbacteria bacterium RIFCSPHIGHO2_01_FULL_63_20]|uniref:Uncharacterized protein n=1 Tax=Candidatus Uhrbacteria bacterium RIFCSPHIGHO2_01_FULL_63_20 TaxID=1802385 RepID=A0A1F7TK61_9BACT|nr:MAG: hypothetical protein A2856_01605 [Candidatus Uhrbacteria bacterium RIFCSPHIGHO2_01_FULL_63_20]